MQSIALHALVVLMMLSVGLELTTHDLTEIPRRGGSFAAAVVLNVVFVPVGAWLLGGILPVSTAWALGLFLLAAAPGGPVGPALARIGDADLGFATALMVLLGFVGLVTVPLTISLLGAAVDGGPSILNAKTDSGGVLWPMFRLLLVYQILPLVAAMLVRDRVPSLAARLVVPSRVVGNVLLAGIVIALVVTRGRALVETPMEVHAALVVVVMVFLSPLLFGRSTRLSRVVGGPVARGLAVITVVRNMSVALLLASRFSGGGDVEVAILIGSFWILVLPVVVGLVVRSIAGPSEGAELVEAKIV